MGFLAIFVSVGLKLDGWKVMKIFHPVESVELFRTSMKCASKKKKKTSPEKAGT